MPKRKAPSPAAASVKVKKEVKREEHDEERPEDGHDPRAVDPRRIRTITKKAVSVAANSRLVVYWMSRDQRAEDNWALLHAQHLAEQKGYGLAVVFCLVPKFLGATLRQYGFMLKGLREVEAKLGKDVAHNSNHGNTTMLDLTDTPALKRGVILHHTKRIEEAQGLGDTKSPLVNSTELS